MVEILTVDPCNPDPSLIEKTVNILRAGGVIAFPTETFYGLGTDGKNEEAIEKIYTIKERSFDKPIPVIIGRHRDLLIFTSAVPEAADKLMDRFWPGGLTLLFHASRHVPQRLTAGTGKIGIRLSSNIIAATLARELSGALTATSANMSGRKECSSAWEVMESIGPQVDAIVDGGHTPGGKGSTIVDVTVDPPVIVREGIISPSLIFETLRKT